VAAPAGKLIGVKTPLTGTALYATRPQLTSAIQTCKFVSLSTYPAYPTHNSSAWKAIIAYR
jgi:hypothetical protein